VPHYALWALASWRETFPLQVSALFTMQDVTPVDFPARPVGWMCQCGERLTEDLDCLACGKTYTKDEQGLKKTKE